MQRDQCIANEKQKVPVWSCHGENHRETEREIKEGRGKLMFVVEIFELEKLGL